MSTQFRRHYWAPFLLLWAILPAASAAESPAGGSASPLFYASFEKRVLADQAEGDSAPLGNKRVRIARGGRQGRALFLDWGAVLSFAAAENVHAEQGTLSFWWQLDEPPGKTPFSIIRISTRQLHSPQHLFAHLFWTGQTIKLRLFDRDSRILETEAGTDAGVVAGRWIFLAFTWHELEGLRFFMDGREVGNSPGRYHFGRWLGQIGIHTQALTPYYRKSNERRAYVDEFRIFAEALSPEAIANLSQLGAGRAGRHPSAKKVDAGLRSSHWAEGFGWNHSEATLPLTAPISVRPVRILSARDLKRASPAAVDGFSESSWPPATRGYPQEGRTLQLELPQEEFSHLSLRGNLKGRIYASEGSQRSLLWDLSSDRASETAKPLNGPRSLSRIEVERTSGQVREFSLLSIRDAPVNRTESTESGWLAFRLLPVELAAELPGQSARQVRSFFGRRTDLRTAYLPRDREAWVAVPEESYKAPSVPLETSSTQGFRHIFLPPFLSHTVVKTIRLRLAGTGEGTPVESRVRWTVKDPILPQRNLLSLDFLWPAENPADIELDLGNCFVPAGQPLWMTVASDRIEFSRQHFENAEIRVRAAAEWQLPGEQAQPTELFSDRYLLIRQGLRKLTRRLDWMSMDFASARRNFSSVDETFRLVEGVLQSRPKDPLGLSFKGLLQPDSIPPEYREPSASPRPYPQWAVQQKKLVDHFRRIAHWWIESRQLQNGAFGGGLEGDTRLAAHWPGIALMDGPAPRLEASLISLVEARMGDGTLEKGFNRQVLSTRQAYRTGLNLAPMLALLDYGSPRWIEMLMETSRHLDRLTAANRAGHRHFQSSRVSATESIREGIHAREEARSPLLWHSVLALADYNRNPNLVDRLKEYAEARLDHWKEDRYPELTLAIHFPTDETLSRGLPGPTLLDLLWGVFRVTGDPAFLRPLSRLVKTGHLDTAQTTAARWQPYLPEAAGVGPFLKLLPRLNLWNRHLHFREAALLARQYAYEATGRKDYLLDYQAALLKHLEQNRTLFTEVELSPAGVHIPHRATQRARLGGIAHAHQQIYAGHALSWENTRGQVAALVSRAKPDALEVTVFNLGETLQDVRMRVWQLENGTYEVTEGLDLNDDGQVDLGLNRRTLRLKRHSSIPVTLRGGKSTIIKAEQKEKGTPIWQLPDLALGPQDFRYEADEDQGEVTLHNLGSAPSQPFRLQIRGTRGRVIFERQVASLPAPLDLLPRTLVVPVSGLRAAGDGPRLHLRILAGSEVEEITTRNNSLWVNLPR
ncbi:MAG: hypothetical protein OXG96_00250 [Acidobacteria bacterium]|nr:hypothetical protein [Acidobacteriota bacterium]